MFVVDSPGLFYLYVNSRSLNNPRRNENSVTGVIWFFVFLGGIFIRSPLNRNGLTGSFPGLSLVRFTCVAFVIVISCIFSLPVPLAEENFLLFPSVNVYLIQGITLLGPGDDVSLSGLSSAVCLHLNWNSTSDEQVQSAGFKKLTIPILLRALE